MARIEDFMDFLVKLWCNVRPVLAVIWSGICWMMFPNDSYIPAAIAVSIAVILDLATKLYSLATTNGGYLQATKHKVITSDVLWRKTQVKIIAYLTIMIMTGLSIRVAPLELLAKGLSTFVYSIIFVREFQSILENLIEAGASGLQPLLFWMKRKEAVICEEQNICKEEEEKSDGKRKDEHCPS